MGGLLHPAQNIFSKIPNRMSATRATYITSPNFWLGKMEGFISLLLPDARTDFLLPTINGYVMFAGSSEEDKNSSKLKRKEIICGWEHTDFIIGQIERISTIPGREKKAHSLFDWKISKTDHVRLAVNIFVGNLDRGNDTKLAKTLFLLKKTYYSWFSSVYLENSTNSIRQMAFFSLITKHLLKSKDTANDLNAGKRNSRKRQKEKNMKKRKYETGTSREYDSRGCEGIIKR